MKMPLAIWLLVVLTIAQLLGPHALFQGQRWFIQHGAHRRLSEQEAEGKLSLLKIPRALTTHTNQWFQPQHEREFRYLGKMYDVARSEVRGDTVWYWCSHDEQETALVNHLYDWIRAAQHQPARQGTDDSWRPRWHEPGFFPPELFRLGAAAPPRVLPPTSLQANPARAGWPPPTPPPKA